MQTIEKVGERFYARNPRPFSWKFPGTAKVFAALLAVLVLGFAVPLWHLFRFAAGSELYSYIPLIPLIAVFLVWNSRKNQPAEETWSEAVAAPSFRRIVGALFLAGVALPFLFWGTGISSSPPTAIEDRLAALTASFLLMLTGVCAGFLGPQQWRMLRFPLLFLAFMIPLPSWLALQVDGFLQESSAVTACTLFRISGTPVLGDHLVMQLPGISLRVARECSGIHSTLILFIVAIVAARLLLRTPWKQWVLVAAVLPLAIGRNALRIFTIGQVCIHGGPEKIHSYIHQHGGPLFFAASLLPLYFLLIHLQRTESKKKSSPEPTLP